MHVLHNLIYIIINYISLLVVGGVVAFDEDGVPLLTDEVDFSVVDPDPSPYLNRIRSSLGKTDPGSNSLLISCQKNKHMYGFKIND